MILFGTDYAELHGAMLHSNRVIRVIRAKKREATSL